MQRPWRTNDNGTSVAWQWQRKAEALGERLVPAPVCPPQIPQNLALKGRFTHSMSFPCRSPAVPCRAAKGLECVFPIWFTQCGRVWFTFAMPRPCHPRPCRSSQGHSTAVERRPCCAVALRRTAWSEHGMANVNQTRPHCVNQMGKTHSKPLAAGERHGRGMGTACYVWIGLKMVWPEFIWSTDNEQSGCIKCDKISWLAEKLLTSQ